MPYDRLASRQRGLDAFDNLFGSLPKLTSECRVVGLFTRFRYPALGEILARREIYARRFFGKKDERVGASLELYNLAEDPGETKDLAARHPDIAAQIERFMQEAYGESPDYPIKNPERSP
ncbi:MAG: hypothetical protein ABIH23_05030 [bacterium]